MRIRVLGPVEVDDAGALVGVGGPQQRRLLALLVVHRGRVLSTDRIVSALWPDEDPPDGAARSVRTYVSRLRAVLPEGSVATHPSGYALAIDGMGLDLDEFDALLDEAERAMPDVAIEHYEAALGIWRGPPFGELTDEWWAVPEATRLTERRISSEERHAAALMAIGHHDRAVAELERLVAEQPLREQPVRLLVQALHVTGRRAEALRATRSFRTRLAEETGLDPSSELTDLESAMLADDDLPGGSADRPLRGYTIHGAIGEGAHGRVYEATQPGTDRKVAIKVIRPDLADATDFVRRFEAEARLVARLEHPHVVPLYDYWREPGGAYLVFRLLGGGTARESVISGGPWSVPRVSRLVEEVGGALIAAHAAGITHNDVKASNVLLDDDGAAYLTDFGIAVAGGDPAVCEHDERGDVRDLAWMIWELLTGSRRPGELSASSGSRLRTGPVPRLIGRLTSVPDGLDAVLERATCVDGGTASVAELVLGWRAATGRPEGALSPVSSSDRRIADSTRRLAARQLALAARAGVNPYRGLRPFDEADAESFHGREEVVDRLLVAVDDSPFVAVVGASGSGKSSVVRAGLVPRLRTRGDVVVTMVPGDDPLGVLGGALTEVATVSEAVDLDIVGALADIAGRLGRVVVVIDQLEECWTRAPVQRREAFLDVVASIVDDGSTDVRFVATVRADLLDRPLEHPTLGPYVGRGAFVLAPLSPAELDAAIVRPAADVGVTIDEAVVADLIAEAVTYPGSLPLLQFTLTELYDRRVDGSIDRSALDAIGGMAGAIGRRAEDVYRTLDDAARPDARQLFARLVVPGAGTPDTRRRALQSELSPGMVVVVDRFVEARLLVTDRDPATREPTVEVAHEALLTRWSRLAGWVEEDRRWLAQLQHLSDVARAWDEGGRRDAELYRGVRLEAMIEALDVEDRDVSPLERSFVDAGRQARDAEVVAVRRTARRLRRRLTAVAVALVVALLAGTVAFVQRRDALDAADEAESAQRSAQVEALVGRAEALRGTERDTAALLAIEAHRLSDTARTRSTLFGTFTDDERFLDAHRFEGDRGSSGIVLPDGASAYLTGAEGRVHPYDLDSGALGDALPPVGDGDRFPVLAASADGRLLSVASRSDPSAGPTTVGLVDTATGSLSFDPITVDGVVTSAVFLPDGRLALAIGEEGRLLVIDAATGAGVADLPGADVAEDEIVWSLDPAGAGGRVLRRPSSVALAGEDLLLGAADGSLRVIDPGTLDVRRTLPLPEETVSRLVPLEDGTVVTSGRYGLARIDLATGAPVWEVLEFETCINVTVVEQQGALFCGDQYGQLEERDLQTGSVRRQLDAQNGGSGSLWTAAGGTELVSFGNNEPVVSRWRLDRSGPITHVIAPGWRTWDFDPTGDVLIVERGGSEETGPFQTGLVGVTDGAVTSPLDGLIVPGWASEDSLIGFALGSEGSFEFAHLEVEGGRPVGAPVPSGVQVERLGDIDANDLNTGKEAMLFRYRYQQGAANDLAAFDVVSLRYGPTIPIDGLVSWAISRTGDRIASGTTTGVVVFDGRTGEQVGAIADSDLRGVFITAADQLFVSSLGGELTLYDLETLEPIQTFGGSRGHVAGGTGTADGSLVAIHGGDRNAALFDVATGIRIGGPITIAPDEHNVVRMSLDGRWMAVGGQPPEIAGDNATQIWDLDPAHWEQAACRVAGRNLTREEWAAHIGELAPYRSTCPDLPSPP